MERRLLLAIVLTFIVLTVYQWMVPVPPATTSSGACGRGNQETKPAGGRAAKG